MRGTIGNKVAWGFVTLILAMSACSNGGSGSTGGSGGTGGGGNTSKGGNDCAQANLAIGYVNSSFQNRTINNGDVHTFAIAGRDALRALQSKAPADVAPALQTLADTYNDFASQTTGVTYNPASGGTPPAEFTTAIQVFQRPGFIQADQKADAYLSANCT